jgi:deferrochelatase/peroxidase EfeB
MTGIEAIWRQNCYALPNEKEPFGYRDGISHPAIEGSGIPGTNPREVPFKAGEFVIGYTDELGGVQRTTPEILGRNGTYVVFRKLHQRVADFRSF